MAQTWGDTLYRGYSAGRAIGNDIAGARYNRRAARVREEYQQRAEAEGKTLEDYLPEMEGRLRQAAIDVGATRRGLSPEGGAIETLRAQVGTDGERRAGALALGGNQAGARDSRARTQYALGSFDNGQSQQIAGDTIRATSGAMRPDGTYDRAAGAQALAGVGARYGDAAQANAQQQGATTFRLEDARAKADSVFNMAQNIGAFSEDQFAGAWEGFKASVPELSNIDVRKGADNKLYLYTDGKATGSIDPANETDVEELATMMSQFTKAPGEALQQYNQTRLANITAAKERDTSIETDYRKARIDVAQKLVETGTPPDVADALIKAQRSLSSSGGSGGWQLQDLGEEAGTYLMQKGGNVYVVKTNQGVDPATGFDGGPVQVFEADGVTPVDPGVLNRSETQTITQSLGALEAASRRAGYELRTESVRNALNVLGSMEAQDRGLARPRSGISTGSGSRADRNNNPGNIKDVGQFRNTPGYRGTDSGGFAVFDNGDAGAQAMENQLSRYMRGEGVAGRPRTTVSDIISLWSPQSDPGNAPGSTRNYANYVAKQLGVNPGDQLDETQIPALAQAMYEFESGNRGPMRGSSGGGAISTGRVPDFAGVTGGARARAALPARSQSSPDATRSQLQQAQDQLARFDRDMGTQQSWDSGGAPGAIGMDLNYSSNLSRAQQRARDQLELRVSTLRRTLADEERTLARTQRVERRESENRQADELVRQYGGAADFMSRAQQAP